MQRLAAVLAGYGVELRQLTPEQLSTLLTLLQLLPKGTGRNLGECPGKEGRNSLLHESLLSHYSRLHGVQFVTWRVTRGEFLVLLFLEMESCCRIG